MNLKEFLILLAGTLLSIALLAYPAYYAAKLVKHVDTIEEKQYPNDMVLISSEDYLNLVGSVCDLLNSIHGPIHLDECMIEISKAAPAYGGIEI